MVQKQTTSGTAVLLGHELVDLRAFSAQVGSRTAARLIGLNRGTLARAMRGEPLRPASRMCLELALSTWRARQYMSLLATLEAGRL